MAATVTGREGLTRPIWALLEELFDKDSLPFLDFSFFDADVAAVSISFYLLTMFFGVSTVSASFLELKELDDFSFFFF